MKGRVIKSTGSWYSVLLEDKIIEARIKGKLRLKGIKSTNPVAVGDIVSLEKNDEATFNILSIEDRKNYIIRKSTNLSKQTHIIASNIDQALLIATITNPVTSSMFIDRFLITAEAYHIPTTIVFNKSDLHSGAVKEKFIELKSIYEKIGYNCIECSTVNNYGLDELKQILNNKITLLSGHSGVGKSTLINSIEPSLFLKTSSISNSYNVGKHTTTFAEMFPLSFGGYIIDTPGIKSFGIVEIEKQELSHRFPEMRAYLNECYFNNCVHQNEPKCAVKKAVELGEISESRYFNYLSILMEEDEKYR